MAAIGAAQEEHRYAAPSDAIFTADHVKAAAAREAIQISEPDRAVRQERTRAAFLQAAAPSVGLPLLPLLRHII